ncbi:MAG: DUF4260 domain-containing protein [Bacteroidota bacterium]
MTARWLRLENLAVAVLAGVLFFQTGTSLWWLLAWIAPDLAMVGYLANPRLGARLYNAAHTYAAPVGLGAVGLAMSFPLATALALLWANHIGVDRTLGHGLKETTGFHDTHLGRIGRG